MVYLSRPYPFKFFKNCLPQILLGPFLNNLSQLKLILTRKRNGADIDNGSDNNLMNPIIFTYVFTKDCLNNSH